MTKWGASSQLVSYTHHQRRMAPARRNDKGAIIVESDSDISIDLDTTEKERFKAKKAGDKRKKDKGKGKPKDTVGNCLDSIAIFDTIFHSKHIHGKPRLQGHGTWYRRTRQGVCRPL